MSPVQLVKMLVVIAALAYLAIGESEARSMTRQEALMAAAANMQAASEMPLLMAANAQANLGQIDSDEDDDDDDRINGAIQAGAANPNAGLDYNGQLSGDQESKNLREVPAVASSDLKTSASHHHHGHGVKGWLDMGAWTGKKGAFGWHDKHPVGKGK